MEPRDRDTLVRRDDPMLRAAPLDPYSTQLLAWFFEIRDQSPSEAPISFDLARPMLLEYGLDADDVLGVYREIHDLDRAWFAERESERQRRSGG